MDNGIAQAQPAPFALPAWKTVLSVSSAVLLAVFFIGAGGWKVTEPFDAASRMVQAKVPGAVALPTAVGFGIVEIFSGVLLLTPRFRRWGAWLTGLMLLGFMAWFGFYYNELRGEDCTCFPWLKRAVGPGFFIGDGIMLALAVFAGFWARPSEGKRNAAIILGAITVFAFALFGVTYARQTGAEAPSQITVNGQPYSLQHGRHLIYFFDPECSHCYQAAKAMSQYTWAGGVKVVGVPTAQPQFAASFMTDTGLKAPVSNDLQLLKKAFPFGDAPYAVAVENGRQKQSFAIFEGDEPVATLRKIGFIE